MRQNCAGWNLEDPQDLRVQLRETNVHTHTFSAEEVEQGGGGVRPVLESLPRPHD